MKALLGVACTALLACSSRWNRPPPGLSEPGNPAPGSGAIAAPAGEARPVASPSSAAPAGSPEAAASSRSPGAPEAPPSVAPFPEGTRSLRVTDQVHVRTAPDGRSRYIGKLTRGTRVTWKRVLPESAETESADTRRRRATACPSWVEIEPMGFVCRSVLAPTPLEPSGDHLPLVQRGKLAPFDYFHVTAIDTNVFETPDAVRGAAPEKQLSTKVMVVGTGTLDVDGTSYTKTDHGLIESSRLARYWPSDFAGHDVRQRPLSEWPFAWVYAPRGGRGPEVRGAPGDGTSRVRRAERRELVRVLEEQDGYVRVGEAQWIERKHLRVASLASPPHGLAGHAAWIDVDLDEQVLVAYEGTQPVFATLVSTGKKGHATPTGLYRVRAKAATTSMAGDPDVPDRYEVSAVPWAIRFRSGLFIHGVYWHDGFGGVLSHGCINVSPKDAAFLYDWIAPAVPPGWSEIEVPANEGAFVRVRDSKHPEPPSFDYTSEDAKQ